MFIREDRKTVIFAKKLTSDFGYQQETRSPQNQSSNLNLLSMPRVKRSYHGLKQTLDRGKSVTFHMFIREDRKTVIFAKKLTSDFGYQQETRSPQNQSSNLNLLSMPRVKRSYHGLKQTLDRGKSVTFPYVY